MLDALLASRPVRDGLVGEYSSGMGRLALISVFEIAA